MPSTESADLLLIAARQGGITDAKEQAHFMGQMQVESDSFTRMHENLNYRAERLLQVFMGRNGLETADEAEAITAGGPQQVAEAIYGGNWGKRKLGNSEPGDGWKFHGRGFIQLTGRANYEHYGKALGLDLVNNPDLAADPANAARIAVQYWKERVVDKGHAQDVTAATRDINGGSHGLSDRKAAVKAWEIKLHHGYHPGASAAEKKLRESPLYKDALAQLKTYNKAHDIPSDRRTEQAAGAIAAAAAAKGLSRIDHLQPSEDGSKLIAVQGAPGHVHSKLVDVSTQQALNTPLADSARAVEQAQRESLAQTQGQSQGQSQVRPPEMAH